MSVAQGRRTHVAQPNRALAAAVYEQIALDGMELGRRYDLRQLLHVRWLDVDDVEALIGDLQVPEIYSEIVGGEIRFLVRVHRNRVYVISVCVGKDSSGGRFDHELHWLDSGNAQGVDARWVHLSAVFGTSVVPD